MTNSEIYRPVRNELKEIERLLKDSLEKTSNKSILEINRYLLESPGKRIRPALVVLSAHISGDQKEVKSNYANLISLGAAVELIHMASLIHDDAIDHALLRHNKPSINAKWGSEVSIALGDYLYSQAFKLIAACKNTEVLNCLSLSMAAMCEGELMQVKERDNLRLEKKQYLVIVKQKTASLMASSCRAGAASVNGKFIYKQALTGYGLNFGIAFQVMDDYLDITSTEDRLGKSVGLDLAMGELTLPFLILPDARRRNIAAMRDNKEKLNLIKEALDKAGALSKTRAFIENYIARAKASLQGLRPSEYKESLMALADFIRRV